MNSKWKDVALVLLAGALIAGFWSWAFGDLVNVAHIDLYPTYIASHLYWDGQYEAIYQSQLWIPGEMGHPAWQQWVENLGVPKVYGTTFVYSPAWLVLIAPLGGLLSFHDFTRFFFFANALGTAWIGYASFALAGEQRRVNRMLGAGIAGCSMPAMSAAALGQNTVLVLSVTLLGYGCFQSKERGMSWLGVGCWVLAATMKPWCILLLLLLPLLKGWRVAVGALTGYGVTNLLLPALFLPELHQGYRGVTARLVEITVPAYNNISVRAHLLRLRWPDWVDSVRSWQPLQMKSSALWLELALVTALAAAMAWGVWRLRPERTRIFVIGCAAVLVPIGVTWTHYLLFAFPLYSYLAFQPSTRWLGRLLLASLVLWAPHPLMTWPWHSVSLPGAGSSGTLWAWRYFSPMILLLLGVAAAFLRLPSGDRLPDSCSSAP